MVVLGEYYIFPLVLLGWFLHMLSVYLAYGQRSVVLPFGVHSSNSWGEGLV